VSNALADEETVVWLVSTGWSAQARATVTPNGVDESVEAQAAHLPLI